MAIPKKVKYRKHHRGRTKGKDQKGSRINFGKWALKALEPGQLSERQLEAARRAIARHMKRGGQIWMRVFPDKPITSLPAESRMGKGKGDVDHFSAVVKPGRIIFEIAGVRDSVAKEALRLARHKLSVKSKVIEKVKQ